MGFVIAVVKSLLSRSQSLALPPFSHTSHRAIRGGPLRRLQRKRLHSARASTEPNRCHCGQYRWSMFGYWYPWYAS